MHISVNLSYIKSKECKKIKQLDFYGIQMKYNDLQKLGKEFCLCPTIRQYNLFALIDDFTLM